jgi:ParB family chromosome partitioning protein
MSTAPRRLGRGLEALLGGTAGANQRSNLQIHQPEGDKPSGELPRVSVYEIDRNPFQPRKEFNEDQIAELAESLDKHGMLQPIVVRRVNERYQLIAGERRLRASIKAGWPDVPVQIRDVDDRQMSELAMIENLQRRDLNALEKAASFQNYLNQYRCTNEELAARLSMDRSTVANLIRLMELPPGVQDSLRSGLISAGHARALLPLGEEREQIRVCQQIQSEGWSVRLTEQRVQEMLDGEDQTTATTGSLAAPAPATKAKSSKKPARTRSSQIVSLEQELRSALGTKIEIRQTARGRGKIVIHFSSAAEFERLRDYMVGEETA